jgi:hypothetical protein
MIKSQLLVCGATTIMHLGTSGKVFLTFIPGYVENKLADVH